MTSSIPRNFASFSSSGTFGKALGGASGGYTAARQEIVDLLRQRSRPYLFSNTVAPAICAASIQITATMGWLPSSTSKPRALSFSRK